LISRDQLEKIDSQKMYKIYDQWSKIARESFQSSQNSIDFGKIDHIVFVGMGGSGSIGDIFASILSMTKIHVNVVKGYVLPKTVDSNSLVVITSVSGNTIETISNLKSAHQIGSKIIAFSSGGEIEKICKKEKIQHRIISQQHSPRASLTGYLFSMLKVLHNSFGIREEDILESIIDLENLNEKINSTNMTQSNPSLCLAEWITNMPMIYFPFGLQSVAIRFKNSLQENAKIHAITEDVIEACHNEIVSWEKESNIVPILIQGDDDNIKTKERWEILKGFFEKKGIDHFEIHSVKGNILSKLINLIYLLDYASIYFAIKLETDPTPTESINYIKEKLKEKKFKN
jgi:glucose/mannose-6-phosphate isomerase